MVLKPILIALALLATALAGCSDNGSGASDDVEFDDDLKATSDTGLIRGVIVDGSITPIAGVTVTVQGQETSQETDDEGRFSFGDLPGGTYFLSAEKPGYFPVQQSVEVVAGIDRPDAVKMLMEADANFNPFFVEEVYHGFIECTSSSVVLCGAPDLVLCTMDISCDPVTNDRYTPTITYEKDPTWIQTELVWESNQALSPNLYLEVEVLDPGCQGDTFITGTEGPSPLLITVDEDQAKAHAIGNEDPQCGIYYSVFSGGVVEDPTGNGLPMPGATVQQEITFFFHSFYGYTPPEDWRFTDEGEVPQPPA